MQANHAATFLLNVSAVLQSIQQQAYKSGGLISLYFNR